MIHLWLDTSLKIQQYYEENYIKSMEIVQDFCRNANKKAVQQNVSL